MPTHQTRMVLVLCQLQCRLLFHEPAISPNQWSYVQASSVPVERETKIGKSELHLAQLFTPPRDPEGWAVSMKAPVSRSVD